MFSVIKKTSIETNKDVCYVCMYVCVVSSLRGTHQNSHTLAYDREQWKECKIFTKKKDRHGKVIWTYLMVSPSAPVMPHQFSSIRKQWKKDSGILVSVFQLVHSPPLTEDLPRMCGRLSRKVLCFWECECVSEVGGSSYFGIGLTLYLGMSPSPHDLFVPHRSPSHPLRTSPHPHKTSPHPHKTSLHPHNTPPHPHTQLQSPTYIFSPSHYHI